MKSDKLILNREVKFDETAGWDWNNRKTSYSDLNSIEQPQLLEDELVDDVQVPLNQQAMLKHKTLRHGGDLCKKN